MIIFVRHSERIDEVDIDQFDKWLDIQFYAANRYRNKPSIASDPPITKNGEQIALQAANTLQNLLNSNRLFADHRQPKCRLYTSRLLRCLQTTKVIAEYLNIREIYVSSGLALTAAAVEKLGKNFDYLNMEDIHAIFGPEYHIHDCDHSFHTTSGSNHESTTATLATEEDGKMFPVSTVSWLDALRDVSNDSENDVKIVIAHRETISNLMPYRTRLPYCALAVCHYPPRSLNYVPLQESNYYQQQLALSNQQHQHPSRVSTQKTLDRHARRKSENSGYFLISKVFAPEGSMFDDIAIDDLHPHLV